MAATIAHQQTRACSGRAARLFVGLLALAACACERAPLPGPADPARPQTSSAQKPAAKKPEHIERAVFTYVGSRAGPPANRGKGKCCRLQV